MNYSDWLVVAASCSLVFLVGLMFARRSSKKGAAGYFAGRLVGNVFKVLGYAVLALLGWLTFNPDTAKKSLVRAWRSCGYLYQIPRSLVGKI